MSVDELARAMAVAGACVLGGEPRSAPASGSTDPHSDATSGSYEADGSPNFAHCYASAWPEPYDAAPDSDSGHANRDLRQVADHGRGLGPGQHAMGHAGAVRDHGRDGVPTAHGEPVRDPSGSQVIRYSSIPDRIAEISRDRDYWRSRALAAEDTIARIKRGYE